jgi:hypothetical protein
MAAQTQTVRPAGAPDSAERLDEQTQEVGRKAGASLLDAFETGAGAVADQLERVAESSQVEWVGTAVRAQADYYRQVVEFYASTARTLVA